MVMAEERAPRHVHGSKAEWAADVYQCVGHAAESRKQLLNKAVNLESKGCPKGVRDPLLAPFYIADCMSPAVRFFGDERQGVRLRRRRLCSSYPKPGLLRQKPELL